MPNPHIYDFKPGDVGHLEDLPGTAKPTYRDPPKATLTTSKTGGNALTKPKSTKGDPKTFASTKGGKKLDTKPATLLPLCYETHPGLIVGGFPVFGGSCYTPIIKDADIYIGFDPGMQMTTRHWPWEPGTEIKYSITDMTAPSNPETFRKLVEWSWEQIKAGKKLHAGCIGGHGRTGTFLAALVAVATGNPDPIAYVRENYCKKAVETADQVNFLVKHYGAATAAVTKTYTPTKWSGGAWDDGYSYNGGKDSKPSKISPIKSKELVWGQAARP